MTRNTPQSNEQPSVRNRADQAAVQARDVVAETINISQDRKEHDGPVTFTHYGSGDQMWEKTVNYYGNVGEERSPEWDPAADAAINGVIQAVQKSDGYEAVEYSPVMVALSNLKAAVRKQDQDSATKHYTRARELVKIFCPEISVKVEDIASKLDAAFTAERGAEAGSDG